LAVLKAPGKLPRHPRLKKETIAEAGALQFSEILDSPSKAKESTPIASALGKVSAELKAGEISAAQAVDLLIETAVKAKLSAKEPQLQQRLRETLRRLIAEDPLLAAKMKKLAEDDT